MLRLKLLTLLCSLCLISLAGCYNQRTPIPDPNLALEDDGPEIPKSGPRRVPRPYPKDKPDYCETTDGRWAASTAAFAGVNLEEAALKQVMLKLDDETMVANVGGKTVIGNCLFHSSASPRQLKIKSSEGHFAGKTILAIYDFPEAGTIRICYDLSGVDFPVDFVSTTENGYFLASYKRSESARREIPHSSF